MNRLIYFTSIFFLTVLSFTKGVAEDTFSLSIASSEQMKKETVLAIDSIQSYHFTKMPLSKIDTGKLLYNYMEELDYHRLFLLKKDVEALTLRFQDSLINIWLASGDLYPAFQVFENYRDRTLNRLDWIFERINGDFNFEDDETFIPDRSEAEWPATTAEADDLWNKRLKYDLLQELLRDESLERAKEKVKRRYRRTKKDINEIEANDIQELFLSALAQLYDPHSIYYSSDSLEEFAITMRNSLVGIGALLRDEDGYCIIQNLIPGGPAEMSGQLHPGDIIVEVAQKDDEPIDVIDMKLRSIVKMIRGVKGTKVRLSIKPAVAADSSERKIVTLIRDEIQLTANLARADVYEVPIEEGKFITIGVIDLPSFYGSGIGGEPAESSTTEDVEQLIEKLNDIGVSGLVLDLRRNGGGLLSEAISLTGLFISKGPVVQVKDTSGRIRKDWDRDPKIVYSGPLAVLVSRRSASASEIVAGALQNHQRAIIIGDASTHGKGTVQAIFELERGLRIGVFSKPPKLGATRITIQKFYLPNGDSTQKEGVKSDIIIPSVNEFLPIGESDLPNALAWDTIEPLDWLSSNEHLNDHFVTTDTLLNMLRNLSEERMQTLDEFTYLKENISWFQKKQDEKEISLNFDQRRKQKDGDTRFKASMDKRLDELSALDFPSTDVLLDLSIKKKNQHQEKLHKSILPNGKPKKNQYYQKVYYYASDDNDEIKEVFVERIDFEKMIKYADDISAFLSEGINTQLESQAIEDIMNQFKNADRSEDFLVEKAFKKYFGDKLEENEISTLLPLFFNKLIEIDPHILEDKPVLDIPLRESFRVVVDWFIFNKDNEYSIPVTVENASSR